MGEIDTEIRLAAFARIKTLSEVQDPLTPHDWAGGALAPRQHVVMEQVL